MWAQRKDWGAFQHLHENKGGKHRRRKGKKEEKETKTKKMKRLVKMLEREGT